MIYLGIDWGEQRIGLSLGSDETGIATPYGVVSGIKEVLNVALIEDVDLIVLGKPVKMSGSELRLTKGYAEFKSELEKLSGKTVVEFDERLTSKAADALVNGAQKGKLTKKQRKTSAPRDAVAAMIILQGYLDLNA